MSIEFYTNQELIEELHKRNSFAGIIIVSVDEHKSDDQVHNDFRLYSTASKSSTINMLKLYVDKLKT